MTTWTEMRENAQRISFDFYKESVVIVVGNETLNIYAVLDTEQGEETIPNTDGSYRNKARLSVWRQDFGNPPIVDEEIKINGKRYLVRAVDDTTDLYSIRLEAQGF